MLDHYHGRFLPEEGDAPWLIGDRLKEFRARSGRRADALARGLELEIEALVRVYETAQTKEWALLRGFDNLTSAGHVDRYEQIMQGIVAVATVA